MFGEGVCGERVDGCQRINVADQRWRVVKQLANLEFYGDNRYPRRLQRLALVYVTFSFTSEKMRLICFQTNPHHFQAEYLDQGNSTSQGAIHRDAASSLFASILDPFWDPQKLLGPEPDLEQIRPQTIRM